MNSLNSPLPTNYDQAFQAGDSARFVDGGPVMTVKAVDSEQITLVWEHPKGVSNEIRLPPALLERL